MGKKKGAASAMFCEHANECPGTCPCDPDCYCKQPGNTCGRRKAVRPAAWGHSDDCLMDKFFAEQAKLPRALRSAGALLVCNCVKCTARQGRL